MIYLITLISITYIYYVIKIAIKKDNNKINDNLKKLDNDRYKNKNS
jgi:hypothetical protein